MSNMGYAQHHHRHAGRGAQEGGAEERRAIASATVSVDLLGGVVVTDCLDAGRTGPYDRVRAGRGRCAWRGPGRRGGGHVEFDDTTRMRGRLPPAVTLSPLCRRGGRHRASGPAGSACATSWRASSGAAVRLHACGEVVFEDWPHCPQRRAPKLGLPFTRVASNAPHWSPQRLPAGEEPGLRETVF
ncbi:hypothetical protein ACTMU2_19895 [Cupriavidus basilensis]